MFRMSKRAFEDVTHTKKKENCMVNGGTEQWVDLVCTNKIQKHLYIKQTIKQKHLNFSHSTCDAKFQCVCNCRVPG